MPRFEPKVADHRVTFRELEPGDYILKITGARPVCWQKDDQSWVAGCRYSLALEGRVKNDGKLDKQFAGDPVAPHLVTVHTDGAIAMTKRFLMAANGFGRNDEDDFDASFGSMDLSVEGDGEDVVGGDGWQLPVGNKIKVTAGYRMWEGNKQQDWIAFSPAK